MITCSEIFCFLAFKCPFLIKKCLFICWCVFLKYLMYSYWYNCDSNHWSAVYKRTYGKDFKFKAGYDSEIRLGWASLWVSASFFNYVFHTQYHWRLPCYDYNSFLVAVFVHKVISFLKYTYLICQWCAYFYQHSLL